jgi:hypothetical protein
MGEAGGAGGVQPTGPPPCSFDPGALLHQKTMNEPFWGSDGATGLDRDEMGRSLGIVGADTRGVEGDSYPSAGSEFFDPLWVQGRYAWDWRGMGLCYPLMRAFGRSYSAITGWRQAPAIDSETHEQSTSARRSHDSPAVHSAAASWLLHVGGIAVHSVWYWGRDANGGVAAAAWPNTSLTAAAPNTAVSTEAAIESLLRAQKSGSGYPYSYLVFPASMDAAARTQAAVNSAAQEVAFIATGVSTPLTGATTDPADRICGVFSMPSKVWHSSTILSRLA